MEEDLDAIANGSLEYLPYLKKFYFGKDGAKGLHEMLKVDIDARATCTIPIGKDEAGRAVNVRVGRYGPFVEQVLNETDQKTASIPDDLPPDQLTVAKALEYISKQAEGPTPLGIDPVTNLNVFLLEGRFGPYVQLGEKPKAEVDAKGKKKKVVKPKMKGLLKGMQPADVTLEIALQLLSFPKSIGVYEKTGEDIIADLGRFGPYLKCGEETRSLSPEDNILDMTFERATTMFDTPKLRGARARVLRDIGNHPADETPIKLYQGRYGPYIKYKKLNVSVPDDINIEEFTVEQAVQLIAAKEAQA
jgi:DNA topoisomerase-1